MRMNRWWLSLILMVACGKSEAGETPGGATDAADTVEATDTDTDTAAQGDAAGACPTIASFDALDGTPCALEGTECQSVGCSDPCQHCNILRCSGGQWQRLEAFPADCSEVTDSADADEQPDANLTDVTVPCPDPGTAEGTPCAQEGQSCGDCGSDPCQFCNLLRCQGGVWTHLEAFPDPNCDDTGDVTEGDAEDCSNQGCGEPPLCGSECAAPCGCCTCSKGESFCHEDLTGVSVRTCSSLGCYAETDCPAGDACFAAGPLGTGCASGIGSCAGVKETYDWIVGEGQAKCELDTDCKILSGSCGAGLGGCWEAVTIPTSQQVLAALGARYSALGCTEAVCDCAPQPASVKCVTGKCSLP